MLHAHVSGKMKTKKNKERIDTRNGKNGVGPLACHCSENIIILCRDEKVVFADSIRKKELLSGKAVKEALP